MNPFTRPGTPLVPRVALPGVDEGEVESLQSELDRYASTRRNFLLAMLRTGRPMYGGTVPGAVVARRRARNRSARRARRVARRAA